jgi:Glycosyltransferase family 87
MENTGQQRKVEPFGTKHQPSRRWGALFFLAGAAALVMHFHIKLEGPTVRWDFQQFYTVAHMIADGQGSRIYDFSAQAEFQMRYVDASRTVDFPDWPFLYPAATALLFVPLIWLPLNVAYGVWIAVNLLLLWRVVQLLQQEAILPDNDWPLIVAITSAPVVVCLMHGQLSILVLFLYTSSFVLARRNRAFLAGLVVGLAAIKFQLILGFVLIMLLRRCWRFVAGAVTGGAGVAAISALVVGPRQFLKYPEFLHHYAYHPRVAMPDVMVNIRGLLRLAEGHEPGIAIVAAISAAVIVGAAVFWRDEERGFALALIVAVITSYHAYPQELTLLLLPLALALKGLEWTLPRALLALLAFPILTYVPLMLRWHGLTGVLAFAILTVIMQLRGRFTSVLIHWSTA